MLVLMQYNIIIFVVGWIKLFRLLWSPSVMFIGKKLLITDSQFSLTWIKILKSEILHSVPPNFISHKLYKFEC